MTDVAGCILAGGLARRMGGGDKGLIEIAGRPILDHVIERLKPQVGALVINANGDPARFATYGLPVVADSIDGFAGPLAGVLSGLDWAAAQGADWVATVATDTPFFPRDLVARLREASAGMDLACASSGGRHHPVVGLWPVRLAEDLRHAMTVEDVRKVDRWTARHRLGVAAFAAEPFDPFFNANRPDDLAEATRILEECTP
jgi:molybdopterin-guanine dinucleotide biosynthesis protein A